MNDLTDNLPDKIKQFFNARDLGDLVASPPPRPKDIISPGILWRKSKMMLSAPKKSGKSTLVVQLALAMAGQCEIFEPLEVNETDLKVLYIQLEMDEYIVYERLAPNWPLLEVGHGVVCSPKSMKIDQPHDFGYLKALVELIRPDVVIIDPLYKIHNRDENDAGDMQTVFDRLDEIVYDYDIGLILIHHHGKDFANDFRRPEDKARGTSKLLDWPDTIVTIEKDEKNDTRILNFVCRRNPEMEPITIKFDKDKWIYRAITGKEQLDKYIIESLPIERSDLLASIEMDLGEMATQAESALRRLKRNNVIDFHYDGRKTIYYLADAT